MKSPTTTIPSVTVNPVSTALWSARVQEWDGAALQVTNTGGNPVSVWVETRLSDTGAYARRPVDDLIDIPAGGSKQFDADISLSRWVALVGLSSGGSTVTVEVMLTQGGRPW